MKVSVLSSGSKGNSVFVETCNHKILIDIGNSCLYIEKTLKELSINPEDIDIVLVTHSHKDHIAGLPVFVKKYNPTVYITEAILKEANLDLTKKIYFENEIIIDTLKIIPVRTSHDVKESYGYILEEKEKSVVYITDTGYIPKRNFEVLKNKNIYVFESNHDVERLMQNTKYPHHIKVRILSDKGHLSNEDSAYYLSELIGNDTKKIILSHLSEENNTEQLAYETLKNKIDNRVEIMIARQNEKTELIEL